MSHAFLAPSSAHRWVKCAFAPTIEAAYPDAEPSPAAQEGTLAHWVAQEYIAGRAVDDPRVTDEMRDGAQLLMQDFEAQLGPDWRSLLVVERHHSGPLHDQNHGTPDYYAWDGNTLHVWDYKFGFTPVDVFENWQLLNYVFCIAGAVARAGVLVDMRIVQPRATHREGPVRNWVRAHEVLIPYADKLRIAARDAFAPEPKATPTPGGCKNCKGRHACEALRKEVAMAADLAHEGQAFDLPADALGRELSVLHRAAKLLKARLDGLEMQAAAMLKSGQLVPGWALDSTPGRKEWTIADDLVIAMGQLAGVDLAKPPQALTPTQALKAGVPAELVDAYSKRPPGAVKLTADDGSKARQIFGA